jgi:hypothetical protein
MEIKCRTINVLTLSCYHWICRWTLTMIMREILVRLRWRKTAMRYMECNCYLICNEMRLPLESGK